MRRAHARRRRGVTLIEVLVTIALVAVLMGGAAMGMGSLSSSRLRASSTRVASAFRVAYGHANSSGRVTRLVFTMNPDAENAADRATISIEDSPGVLYLQSGDITGGAEATTEFEKSALEEGQAIAAGERPPRPAFSPVKNLNGFRGGSGTKMAVKSLEPGILFRQVEVMHDVEPVTEGRAYVYFFPGGQAEPASIQVMKNTDDLDDDDILTIQVAPLTGKTTILGGPKDLPRPTTDEEASERGDTQ
ncbi:MAG: prepilin-type N-terminal cleavage/methylation domain-containing protein [Myxococcota bacterium]